MEYQLLLSLSIIHLLALASPGPDFALVVRLATQESRTAAVASALGIAVAILGHTLLSLTGVSIIIQSSNLLFTLVQLAGASYLAWMGIGAIKAAWLHWRDPVALEKASNSTGLTGFRGFLQGLYTNLLNPKALVFFITLFSTLITPTVSLSTKSMAALLLFLLSFIWFSFIAVVLSKPRVQLKMKKASPFINLVTGTIFVGVALTILSGVVVSH
ncbi:LysE family transporter [Shewanella schlegeliana]|uniref:LysE family transporter n=1 Tax=Shewanella schlegeliana TaxID=190308 RepID=A0ABS1T5R0_9GAMM|nr:LysE family transporter [Shewanella schlegeliana]MBL4915167.1 LysE family transporter [Shewanella schlegeliana]MCL1110965.1 LysE family transporter [Shewanella schlegeliana]GIU29412.1 lysine transporter LysE [Shewanella schlegeliana]